MCVSMHCPVHDTHSWESNSQRSGCKADSLPHKYSHVENVLGIGATAGIKLLRFSRYTKKHLQIYFYANF